MNEKNTSKYTRIDFNIAWRIKLPYTQPDNHHKWHTILHIRRKVKLHYFELNNHQKKHIAPPIRLGSRYSILQLIIMAIDPSKTRRRSKLLNALNYHIAPKKFMSPRLNMPQNCMCPKIALRPRTACDKESHCARILHCA